MAEKKVLLFIVEGQTDETALAPALEKIVVQHNVKFKFIRTDITSDFASTVSNIERRIKEQAVKKFLAEHPQFSHNDICGIVHITDIDGAFISDDSVIEKEIEDSLYFDDHIECKDKDLFLLSKKNKQDNLTHLSKLKDISIPYGIRVPYSIYYMSCNLDHVLHNERNLSKEEKIEKSLEFADDYDDPIKFKNFFLDDNIKVSGTYDETWDYIKHNLNSLKRCSNFWLCINQY